MIMLKICIYCINVFIEMESLNVVMAQNEITIECKLKLDNNCNIVNKLIFKCK